jgi:predicted short-subunit dehydrogenase-like oxidoreductase (DUF2520 family)
MKTLNIIGAGRVGRTLAALWRQRHVMEIHDVFNRAPQSTRDAVAFIGAGRAAESLATMRPADLWMLATPDSELPSAAARLAASGRLRAGDLVFHCSGALASSELRASFMADVHVASVHPLKTFADPQDAARTFAGTYCVAEGDAAALSTLKPAFEQIGARVSEIDPQHKTIYHAASVIVSNYLTALLEAGLQCYEKAGLPRDTAAAMMAPLVRETVDNIFKLGTVKALTGPIARGDAAVVERQVRALQAFDPRIADVYRALGRLAVDLSRAQGGAPTLSLQAIEALLQAHKPT